MNVLLISFNLISLNTRILSSSLKKHGHRVHLLFCTNGFNSANIPQFIEFIKSKNVDLIGVSLMTDDFPDAKIATDIIKEYFKVPVIWGGAHPSILPDESLKYADIICIGEGEEALLELCEKMEHNSDYSSIQNLWMITNNTIIKNELRPLEENLDMYPFSDYELDDKYILTQKDYIEFSETQFNNAYDIMTSRGCPHSCSYCYNNQRRKMYSEKGKYLRYRSIENVIDELVFIKNKFKTINSINFWDDNLVSRTVEELEIFSKAYKQKVNLPFYCLASPGKLNEDKIILLKACGLTVIQIGIQTGSKEISELYRRHTDNKDIIKLSKIINKYKITAKYDLIFNNPYETEEDIIDTINLLLEIPKPYIINGYNLIFYPGTEMYEKGLKDKYISLNKIEQDSSSIYSPINSPVLNWNSKLSNRLYFCNYSIENKRYLNSLIALIPHYPNFLIRILLFSENRITKKIVKLLSDYETKPESLNRIIRLCLNNVKIENTWSD